MRVLGIWEVDTCMSLQIQCSPGLPGGALLCDIVRTEGPLSPVSAVNVIMRPRAS